MSPTGRAVPRRHCATDPGDGRATRRRMPAPRLREPRTPSRSGRMRASSVATMLWASMGIPLHANGYGGVCSAAPTAIPSSQTVSRSASSPNLPARNKVSSMVVTGSRRYSGSAMSRNAWTCEFGLHDYSMITLVTSFGGAMQSNFGVSCTDTATGSGEVRPAGVRDLRIGQRVDHRRHAGREGSLQRRPQLGRRRHQLAMPTECVDHFVVAGARPQLGHHRVAVQESPSGASPAPRSRCCRSPRRREHRGAPTYPIPCR